MQKKQIVILIVFLALITAACPGINSPNTASPLTGTSVLGAPQKTSAEEFESMINGK